jgi:hypothetical protein
MNAVREMAASAEKLAISSDDALTYLTANLEETMRIVEKYGVRHLAQEEIAHKMPALPIFPRNMIV